MTQTPAGWHPDPTNPHLERYWDGSAWTDQTREAAAGRPPTFAAPQVPAKKKHTVRNVILGLLLLGLLFIGGCIALIGGAANEIDKSIEADANKPGGTENPLVIVEGEAFEVDGFAYSPGWRVVKDSLGSVDISGLKVTNNRDDRDSAIVEIKFLRGTEVLASVDCTTEPIQQGATVTLTCLPLEDFPTGYRSITINDTF